MIATEGLIQPFNKLLKLEYLVQSPASPNLRRARPVIVRLLQPESSTIARAAQKNQTLCHVSLQ